MITLPVSIDKAGMIPVDEPVPGGYYWVSFVNVERVKKTPKWMPILGPLHEDKAVINFPYLHWHMDWRFASQGYYEDRLKLCVDPARIHMFIVNASYGYAQKKTTPDITTIHRRFVKCRRLMPPYPEKVRWGQQLEAAFADTKMKCLTCPHRGLPLDPRMAKDGVITCTGHGLKWNLQTGDLVPTP